jgi:hypothetical protein
VLVDRPVHTPFVSSAFQHTFTDVPLLAHANRSVVQRAEARAIGKVWDPTAGDFVGEDSEEDAARYKRIYDETYEQFYTEASAEPETMERHSEGADTPMLDARDATGLTYLAYKLGKALKKLGEDAVLVTVGASPEILAALVRTLFPEIKQARIVMSGVKEKDLEQVASDVWAAQVLPFIVESLGAHAFSDAPLVLMDAVDTGATLAYLTKILRFQAAMRGSDRRVLPVGINTIERKTVGGVDVHRIGARENDLAADKAKKRFTSQTYKYIFPRATGKVPLSDIRAGRGGDQQPDREQWERQRAIADALLDAGVQPDVRYAGIEQFRAEIKARRAAEMKRRIKEEEAAKAGAPSGELKLDG